MGFLFMFTMLIGKQKMKFANEAAYKEGISFVAVNPKDQ